MFRGGSWLPLPTPTSTATLPADVARAIYTFAGKEPEVLRYIPCYCGCRMQGHHSNHDCFVKRRTTDGRVGEWDVHGLVCPLAPDITGDVMLWHERGRPMSVIRKDIDKEFGHRGPATPTPLPPER
jgi:hypothetical protein